METLGTEIAEEVRIRYGKDPDAVIITHAGGGNLTGTARGLLAAGADKTRIVACSVDLSGLHMASDTDFNKKSFTTGHTGFGVPFATWPDRADVPRNAARSMRYMDEYQLVTQGEVFFVTELLTKLEGIERGPAGNTSLTAAITMARQMDRDQIVVVQETEYTGAGKHHTASSASRVWMIKFTWAILLKTLSKTIVLPETRPGRGKPRILKASNFPTGGTRPASSGASLDR